MNIYYFKGIWELILSKGLLIPFNILSLLLNNIIDVNLHVFIISLFWLIIAVSAVTVFILMYINKYSSIFGNTKEIIIALFKWYVAYLLIELPIILYYYGQYIKIYTELKQPVLFPFYLIVIIYAIIVIAYYVIFTSKNTED